MPTAGTSDADTSNTGQTPTGDSGRHRWEEMLGSLAELLPARSRCVLVDGSADRAEFFASRLAEKLGACRRPVQVTVVPRGDTPLPGGNPPGPPSPYPPLDENGSWDVTVFLRSVPGGRHFPVFSKDGTGGKGGKDRHGTGETDAPDRREREERADIVIDLHDLQWPVIRRVAAPLAGSGSWYLTETRAFFACRAATWDAKFGDDLPAYGAAVEEAGIRRGGVVLDVGCGTGRALSPLRAAVGPAGTVIALDMTPEMLRVAHPAVQLAQAMMVIADARSLPFDDGSVDAIFAAGLVNHLPDTEAGLRELARVTARGGKLILFHPSGRAALAARHGHALSPDEPLAEGPLRRSTTASGWQLTAYDDAPHRFFAVAERR